MGMVYALMAMGLILIVKAVGVMNFAHGQLLMLGGYISYLYTVQLGMGIWGVLICTMLTTLIFGVVYMFTIYWPLRDASWPVTVTISTLGASMVLKEGVRIIWGSLPMRIDEIKPGYVSVGESAQISYQYIYMIVVSAILIAFVFTLFEKLRIGRVMTAAAQDRYAAELMGIPVILTIALTFMISVTLSGIGGLLVAPIFMISQSLGGFALKAFAGIVVGGLGNVKGAVVGSLLIGIIESFSILVTVTYKDAMVFGVMILILLIKPTGLFGEKISEKA